MRSAVLPRRVASTFCTSAMTCLSQATRMQRRDAVGSTAFPVDHVSAPEFGTRRRRHQRASASELADKAVIEGRKIAMGAPATQQTEDDAETLCRSRYGFFEKPPYLPYWSQFLAELRRYELRWSVSPGVGTEYHLDIVEFTATGESFLCRLHGDGSQCQPIADMFNGIGAVVQGVLSDFSVPFLSHRSRPQYLVFTSKPLLSAPSSTSSATASSSSEAPRHHQHPDIPNFVFQSHRTGYAFSVCIMEQHSPIRTPLIHELSLQATTHMMLQSMPPFFRRTDIGVRNADLMPKDQIQAFRFLWCFLRRECRMVPMDMANLDDLLPPGSGT